MPRPKNPTKSAVVDFLNGGGSIDDAVARFGVSAEQCKEWRARAARDAKRATNPPGLEAPKTGGNAYERARTAAGLPPPGTQDSPKGPPRRIPTGEEVVAWIQGLFLGIGEAGLAACKIHPTKEAVELFVFSREERNGLMVPAEAAAPDIAEILGDTKYVALGMLGVSCAGMLGSRFMVLREAMRARVVESQPKESPRAQDSNPETAPPADPNTNGHTAGTFGTRDESTPVPPT